MEYVIRRLVIDPGPLVVQVVLVCHSIGIIAHGPVSGLGTSQMIEERFMNPIGEIIAAHVPDFAVIQSFEYLGDFIQSLVP